jgi:hypothetical protein
MLRPLFENGACFSVVSAMPEIFIRPTSYFRRSPKNFGKNIESEAILHCLYCNALASRWILRNMQIRKPENTKIHTGTGLIQLYSHKFP